MYTLNIIRNRQAPIGDASPDSWAAPAYTESTKVSIDYRQAESNHCLINNQGGIGVDCVKVLRTKLLTLTRANNWRTVMITSVHEGEGKTVTAINLAFAMAREHQQTVALVECDLRTPSICNYLGIETTIGLTNYFMNNTPLQDIIVWPEVDKLTLIPAGQPLAESSEVLGSPRMEQLVQEMKSRYQDRYVFFDFPPLLAVADPLAFMPYVDCVLMVVEAGRTPARDIKEALSLIPKGKLLGLVLNKDRRPNARYYGS